MNFPFPDSYFMQLASESWIRKQEFALLEFPVFWQTFYRDFLNCRPKVYLFNTHWLWKYLQNWHQIHPRSKLAINSFSRRNRIWSSFSADRLDRWSVATNPPYENSLSTLGKPCRKKSAVFLNIVQKAFDPPHPSFEHVCGEFFWRNFNKSA